MKFDISGFNESQRKVIEHESGPLVVISGAGTGKTHVLTGRILELIRNRGVAPESILALTFTEKATQEMIARIDEGLPLGQSPGAIQTFHSFCDSVLRERGLEIGIDTEYKILSDADLMLFLKRHYHELKLDYFASRTNPERIVLALYEHFNRLQDEDISTEKYKNYAREISRRAENADEKETAIKHLELASAYEIYMELLIKNGALDYGGLLFHTLRLFENRPSVLAEYQNRFMHILIDEFQDTNFIQNKIVALLAARHKNIIVVGDDDQAIYKWRGASLLNFEYFHKKFPEAKVYVLNDNYRSQQTILNASYHVIQKNNPRRLEVTHAVPKKLRAIKNESLLPVEIRHSGTLDEEVEYCVSKAAREARAGKSVALLVRTNALASPFIEGLQSSGASFDYSSNAAFFAKKGVKDIIALIRLLMDPHDDIAVFRFFSLPFWKITMERLLEMLSRARRSGAALLSSIDGADSAKAKALLKRLMELSRESPVGELIGTFLNESGYLAEASERGDQETIEAISSFSEIVKEFEKTHAHKTVRDFFEYLTLLEESSSLARSSNEGGCDALIKILTVHGAKGLEFDTVIVPGLVQNKFPSINRRDQFEIAPELLEEELPEGNYHLEEERRLFYVACTRAREKLIVSYSDYYDGKRQWKQSLFIEEILESGCAKISHSATAKKNMTKNQQELPLETRSHRPIRLAMNKLSYSQIDTFVTCPLKYQFRYLFQLPTLPSPHLSFGTAMHNTLRDFYTEIMRSHRYRELDMFALLRELYKKNWISSGYSSRRMQEEQFLHGLKMLESYYEKNSQPLVVPAFVEKSFLIKLGQISISGRIDRIDRLEDGSYEIIDYKTGDSSKKNLSTDLQLSIYALAARETLKLPVSKLSLYFLEDCEKASTTRSNGALDECAREIIECAGKMDNSDFEPTPGFHCSYCDYRLLCPAVKSVVK